MKSFMTLVAVAAISTASFAQLTLPAPSPKASVTQTVGVTDITIEYSSPAVNGRKIFGGLVPFNEIWRTGANKATKISFSTDVTIGGTAVKAGDYSIFTIPGESEWTIILNNETELWGAYSYKEEDDAVRIKVKSNKGMFMERMTFGFSDFTYTSTKVNLMWDKTHVSFDIQVPTHDVVMTDIDATLNPSARTYARAARYTMETGNEREKGLAWAKKAVELDESNWYNSWLYASILGESGDYRNALTYAKKAWDLGLKAEEAGENFFYKDRVKTMVEDFTAKNG